MSPHARHKAQIDPAGRLELPPGVAGRFGLLPGEQIVIEENDRQLILHRPVTFLERVYLEITNTCNLGCRTCVRNVWEEPLGFMDQPTYQRLLDGMRAFNPLPTVFFGGFGEPLAHPGVLDMVRTAAGLGVPVEMITNGVLLDEAAARGLLEAGLHRLWVSLDGATPDRYLDVRLGDELPAILANLRRFKDLRTQTGASTGLGIAFVALRRNLADLPAVLELGLELGADHFSVTNVLAHTREMRAEILYERTQYQSPDRRSTGQAWINLPRTDLTPEIQAILARIERSGCQVVIAGEHPQRAANRCPFIEKGSLSVRWDGQVSPCLALLHTQDSYLDNHLRRSHATLVGDLNRQNLAEIWLDPHYIDLRRRLKDFDFSPCTICNSCEMAEQNLEDCFGNLQPACGGCLWAQGLIQCP